MKALECMIAWNPVGPYYETKAAKQEGAIKVGPWPDKTGWSRDYRFTIGGCLFERHKFPKETIALLVLADFHTCVVRDGIDPLAAHREFAKIDEYRKRISPDSPPVEGYRFYDDPDELF